MNEYPSLITALKPLMTEELSTESAASELSIGEALAYAVKLHRSSQLDAAETLYTRIIEVIPEHADALHFLGVLRHQRGESESAIQLIRQASRLAPNHADCFINLGNVLAETGDLEQATDAYNRALELAPERADIHNNLGVIYKMQSLWDEAEHAYKRAIELSPDSTNAYNNIGLLYAARGQIKEAVHYYCRAVAMMPGNPDSRRLLGIAYYTLGKTREAAEVFRQWLEAEPDNPVARHMHAACSGIDVPERAGNDYIEHTFDRFAGSFEKQLQEKLAYKAPELVAQAFQKTLQPGAAGPINAILDAGCGTGLCGPLLRHACQQLVGVDLSGGMLAKAEEKSCYDKLVKTELTSFMATSQQQFNAIVSADTLVYFGPLEDVFAAARHALCPDGVLVFTVEQAEPHVEPSGYRINPHGRYAHERGYLESSLSKQGFKLEEIAPAVLRHEGGENVLGWVVSARRA